MAQASKSKTKQNSAKKSATRKAKVSVAAEPKKKPVAKSAKPVKKTPAAKKPAKSSKRVDTSLSKLVEQALADIKAVNVAVFDVRDLTDVADTMIIASGTSDRHVRSIAERVVEAAKKAGIRPMGVEGERDGEWVLVDLQDVILHVMLPRVREVYRLENLWDVSAARREAAGAR